MATVTISAETNKLLKDYAKKKGMTANECAEHFLPRGIKRDMALQKHRAASGGTATRKKTSKKKTAKKKVAKKRAGKKANGKSKKVTDAQLLRLKKSGLSNPQIAKETGLSKDQVFRRIKAAQA